MFFKDVIGQGTARQRSIQEIQEGRISHAQFLCGPAGAGKLPLALAYTRYICCPNHTEIDVYGTCPSYVKWSRLVHPDVHFVFPIVKSAKGKKEICDDCIADWRRFVLNNSYFSLNRWLNAMGAENRQAIICTKESDEVTRKLSLKSGKGGYRVTVIWLPERMHEVCANKLLKLLEGPPKKTVFLLVPGVPEMILSAILNRTQRFNIRKIEETSIVDALQRKCGVQPIDSQTIAYLASGNFVKALETIHLNEESGLFFNLFISLMRPSYQRKIREMKLWSKQLAAMGRERQKSFPEHCQHVIRKNFIYSLHRKEMNYTALPEQNFATHFAPLVNEYSVIGIMDELSEAQIHIEQNMNARMVFLDFSLKMIVLLKQWGRNIVGGYFQMVG